ncbi:MAG: PEP-CTERM sorting domain-containing protein [Armatimonadota bacterium]|nr:PEP-CTERM sorting domain-containing protein [Armatimonadota bacterium]
MKTLIIAAAMAVAASSQAIVLFNNADGRGLFEPLGIGTEVRPAGGFYSRLNTPPGNVLGFSSSGAFRLADDFSIADAGWQIDSASTFVYLTNATAPTVTGGTFDIRDNTTTPGTPGLSVASGTFSSVAFTDIYRIGSTVNDARRVQRVEVNFSSVVLLTGTYWLDFNFVGGSFTPPLTAPAANVTPGSTNAKQWNGAAWVNAIDTGTTGLENFPKDMPFLIHGSVVPEPGTFIAIGIGLAGLALARRRK